MIADKLGCFPSFPNQSWILLHGHVALIALSPLFEPNTADSVRTKHAE